MLWSTVSVLYGHVSSFWSHVTNTVLRWFLDLGVDQDCPPMVRTIGIWETFRLLQDPQLPWRLLSIANETGSFTFRLPLVFPGLPMVVAVGDGKIAQAILKCPQNRRPHWLCKPLEWGFRGPNIISSSGMAWEHRRRHVNLAFMGVQLRRMEQMVASKVQDWMRQSLFPHLDAGTLHEVDISHEMLLLTLDIFSTTALEYDMSLNERETFILELRKILSQVAFSTIANPFSTGLFSGKRSKALQGCQKLHQFSLKIVRHHRNLSEPVPGTLLDRVMKNPNYKNDEERASDVTFYIVAGHDTNAHTLSFLLRELSRPENQELQHSIRHELLSTKNNPAAVHKSDLLLYSVKETLRLYPIAGLNAIRIVDSDDVTMETRSQSTAKYRKKKEQEVDTPPMRIPKGSIAIVMACLTQRNPLDYGPSASMFDPYRWTDPGANTIGYIPFSAGPQNCVGQRFAMIAVTEIAKRILLQCQLQLHEEGTTEFFVTWKPQGLRLRGQRCNE